MLLVAILHVIAYLVTSSSINLPVDRKPTALEWVFFSPSRVTEPIRTNPPDVTVRSRATALAPKPLTPPLSSPDDSSTHHATDKPATDWNSELELAAKSAAGGDASAQRRDFGFPRRAPSPKTPTFDWDPVHTHRVEIGPEGGMIVHLSDKCVMVFMPFPFPICGIGKKEANGHLLDHLRDASAVAEAPAP
jgi:hypothetical protein